MEAIRDVNDFKKFFESNKEKICKKIIKASDISVDDEWMQDNQWDEIYNQEESKKDGNV